MSVKHLLRLMLNENTPLFSWSWFFRNLFTSNCFSRSLYPGGGLSISCSLSDSACSLGFHKRFSEAAPSLIFPSVSSSASDYWRWINLGSGIVIMLTFYSSCAFKFSCNSAPMLSVVGCDPFLQSKLHSISRKNLPFSKNLCPNAVVLISSECIKRLLSNEFKLILFVTTVSKLCSRHLVRIFIDRSTAVHSSTFL